LNLHCCENLKSSKHIFDLYIPLDVCSYTKPDIGYPYDVTVTRRESEGFGFVIISSANKQATKRERNKERGRRKERAIFRE
jgi:hypothetical protein